MPRINWMNVATWLVFCVSLILAIAFGYYSWNNLTSVQADKQRINQQIALQDQEARKLQENQPPVVGILTQPTSQEEDGQFLRELQDLMRQSNVSQVQLDRIQVNPMPSIASTAAPEKRDSNQPSAPEPSLINLPGGVRAFSMNLVVHGNWLNVRQFLYRVRNYRYQRRAINLNTLQVVTEEKGLVRATMQLTRFVSPATALNPIPADPKAPARLPDTTPSGLPNTPGMPGHAGTPERPGVKATPDKEGGSQ